MKPWTFIKSPTGNLAIFAGIIVLGGLLLHRSNVREQVKTAQLTKVETADGRPLRESIVRAGQPLALPGMLRKSANATDARAGADGDAVGPLPTRDGRAERPAPKPKVLPISLVSGGAPASKDPGLSSTYAPFGRLIPCETVITLESSRLETPVIGLVTEDIWHEGRLIIPAGAEVHGRAALDRSRERIAASGKWVVVWRDGSPLNGTEIVLNGIALEREKNDVTGQFGLRDGSAGLVGQVLKSDDWQEIKLFAATFLAGAASGLQQLRNQGAVFGDLAQVPIASGRNATLQGTANVLNAYARQIQETIARDGFFVRVGAGHQFYLYVTETIDVARGTRGNVANAEIWRKQNEK